VITKAEAERLRGQPGSVDIMDPAHLPVGGDTPEQALDKKIRLFAGNTSLTSPDPVAAPADEGEQEALGELYRGGGWTVEFFHSEHTEDTQLYVHVS
jgi:hypothetical protein